MCLGVHIKASKQRNVDHRSKVFFKKNLPSFPVMILDIDDEILPIVNRAFEEHNIYFDKPTR